MLSIRSGVLASLIATALLLGPLSGASRADGIDMAPINAMDQASFVQKFGGIFEKSPWVAEKAYDRKPFASVDDLHAAMVAVARTAPAPSQLALLQSHPDLAGKEALAGEITADSRAEQKASGLASLTADELARFTRLNDAYKAKFGFPFIIAVRMYSKEGIFFEFKRRLQNDTTVEFANDMQNVYAITRLRLDKMLKGS